jgi:hypothetical protein
MCESKEEIVNVRAIYSDGEHEHCGNVGVFACIQSIVGLATGSEH